MKPLIIGRTSELERVSPVVWSSCGTDPSFEFDLAPIRDAFVCFFLKTAGKGEPPRITFDTGGGFNELSALSLKSFPFAFYHLPLARAPARSRLRFRPCTRRETFHFVAFQTSNALLVAVLHFLFNLRYQKIGIIDPGARDAGTWQILKATASRVAAFFGDVSQGQGLRVQEGSQTLAALRLALSLKAAALRSDLDTRLAGQPAPLLSFIAPTYNTPPAYLNELVQSFTRENASYAELVLSDDGSTDTRTLAALKAAASCPSVRIVANQSNQGIAIATNAGIAAARGTYVGFIDHDDAFVTGGVAAIADAILKFPDALFFYTDEIIVDSALKPIGAFCKPAFDSVLLSGVNYINHLSIYRRDRLDALGRLREDREGSQDYDLLLRYLADVPVGSVIHIPFLAYMWRREEGTYSHRNLQTSTGSARLALAATYESRNADVRVEPALDRSFHRVRFTAQPPAKRVSVVIPNRDSPSLIKRVVDDLLERTSYATVEIVIVDNGTTDQHTLAFYHDLKKQRTDAVIDIRLEPFNFARMCNRGARLAKGEAVLFLNNDVEVTDADWLSEMVECLAFEATGIVGARLLYPNGKIQHHGVIVGLGNAAGHWYDSQDADEPGPMGRFFVRQTLSAVTAACMLVTRTCFDTLDGFDEESFAIAYNDVDFCMRARKAGFRTVWTPFATLVHHESASRGSDQTGDKNVRFKQEMSRLQARHHTETMIDDAFSPFYDRREARPYIIVPETLPPPRPNVMR